MNTTVPVWVSHTEMLGLAKVQKMSEKILKIWKCIFKIA